jgi:hypothetical protein
MQSRRYCGVAMGSYALRSARGGLDKGGTPEVKLGTATPPVSQEPKPAPPRPNPGVVTVVVEADRAKSAEVNWKCPPPPPEGEGKNALVGVL